ncbi:unnamed protein product [Ectocarpus sp. 12 AP-2014]
MCVCVGCGDVYSTRVQCEGVCSFGREQPTDGRFGSHLSNKKSDDGRVASLSRRAQRHCHAKHTPLVHAGVRAHHHRSSPEAVWCCSRHVRFWTGLGKGGQKMRS